MDRTYIQAWNGERLTTELIAAFGPTATFRSDAPGAVTVQVPNGIAPATVDSLMANHDAVTSTARQQQAAADDQALDAFRLGWILGQARLGNVAANSIQKQMDAIDLVNINSVGVAQTQIKIMTKAIKDLADQLQKMKRAVAIQANVPDR